MPFNAIVSAPLIVAVVFAVSAAGKLADPQRAARGFDALDVPAALARPWMRTAHPWVELLMALGLVAIPGVPALLTATVSTVLAFAYLVLVVRAARRPEPTDCACFGLGGAEEVTGWTVARNIWLFALCIVCVAVALDGRSPLQRVAQLGAEAWWLLAVAAATVMAVLIVRPGASEETTAGAGTAQAAEGLAPEEYVRTPIPNAPVTLVDGRVQSLRQLATARPQLLLAVSGTCYSCLPTIEAAAGYRDRLPEVDVFLLYVTETQELSDASQPPILDDRNRFAYDALQLGGTPSAVLLGADGMLAGGPVAGPDAIEEFITDIETELLDLRELAAERS